MDDVDARTLAVSRGLPHDVGEVSELRLGRPAAREDPERGVKGPCHHIGPDRVAAIDAPSQMVQALRPDCSVGAGRVGLFCDDRHHRRLQAGVLQAAPECLVMRYGTSEHGDLDPIIPEPLQLLEEAGVLIADMAVDDE